MVNKYPLSFHQPLMVLCVEYSLAQVPNLLKRYVWNAMTMSLNWMTWKWLCRWIEWLENDYVVELNDLKEILVNLIQFYCWIFKIFKNQRMFPPLKELETNFKPSWFLNVLRKYRVISQKTIVYDSPQYGTQVQLFHSTSLRFRNLITSRRRIKYSLNKIKTYWRF